MKFENLLKFCALKELQSPQELHRQLFLTSPIFRRRLRAMFMFGV